MHKEKPIYPMIVQPSSKFYSCIVLPTVCMCSLCDPIVSHLDKSTCE